MSEILSKLGVATREDAAAWTAEEPRLWTNARIALASGCAAVVVIAVVGLGVLAWGVLEAENRDEERIAANECAEWRQANPLTRFLAPKIGTELLDGVICWTDTPAEASFEVELYVGYSVPCERGEQWFHDPVPYSAKLSLPKDTVFIRLPPPSEPRYSVVSGYRFSVKARDDSGGVVGTGGFLGVTDCFPPSTE